MRALLDRLQYGEIMISDGAMGTLLQAQGLLPGECPELWNITHPEIVRGIAEAYRDAGSTIVETNSFGGTRYKLEKFGLGDRIDELNQAAARLAREAVLGHGYVAASVGPTGEIAEDEGGNATEDDFYRAFAEQARALAAGGADALCIETQSSIIEAAQAVRAGKAETGLPVICTFTFSPGAQGFRTMMGATPQQAAEAALAAGADIIGANCGGGMSELARLAQELRRIAPNALLIIQPNAGLPVLENGKTVFKETPEDMAARVTELRAAGVNIIGGCCGTTPAHIAAIAKAARVGKL